MKRMNRQPVFWMVVMTVVYFCVSVKQESDRMNMKPPKQFTAMLDAMYRGETEQIRILTTDGTDVTETVLKGYEKAYQRHDYDGIYTCFQDIYVICYDPVHADLNH
ncbi:MAG: hypothetical protein ACI32N_06350 [Bulleidia sp.]